MLYRYFLEVRICFERYKIFLYSYNIFFFSYFLREIKSIFLKVFRKYFKGEKSI